MHVCIIYILWYICNIKIIIIVRKLLLCSLVYYICMYILSLSIIDTINFVHGVHNACVLLQIKMQFILLFV